MHQLKLWESMQYILDDTNRTLRAYKLHHKAKTMKGNYMTLSHDSHMTYRGWIYGGIGPVT